LPVTSPNVHQFENFFTEDCTDFLSAFFRDVAEFAGGEDRDAGKQRTLHVHYALSSALFGRVSTKRQRGGRRRQ